MLKTLNSLSLSLSPLHVQVVFEMQPMIPTIDNLSATPSIKKTTFTLEFSFKILKV